MRQITYARFKKDMTEEVKDLPVIVTNFGKPYFEVYAPKPEKVRENPVSPEEYMTAKHANM